MSAKLKHSNMNLFEFASSIVELRIALFNVGVGAFACVPMTSIPGHKGDG
jgi:hypothetical protein